MPEQLWHSLGGVLLRHCRCPVSFTTRAPCRRCCRRLKNCIKPNVDRASAISWKVIISWSRPNVVLKWYRELAGDTNCGETCSETGSQNLRYYPSTGGRDRATPRAHDHRAHSRSGRAHLLASEREEFHSSPSHSRTNRRRSGRGNQLVTAGL